MTDINGGPDPEWYNEMDDELVGRIISEEELDGIQLAEQLGVLGLKIKIKVKVKRGDQE